MAKKGCKKEKDTMKKGAEKKRQEGKERWQKRQKVKNRGYIMAEPRKGTIYKYKTGKYIREKLGSTKGCADYRVIPVEKKPGRKVLICVTKKKGPKGGRTKAVSLLRSLRTKKGKALAKKAIVKNKGLRMLVKSISIFLSFWLFASNVYADVCFSDEDARRLLREIKECHINEEIIKEQERAISNLKSQVELYKEEVRLLREIIELERGKANIYKVAYEDERKKANLSLFEKGKFIGYGILIGIIGGLLWLPK